MFFDRFPEEFECSLLVAGLRDEAVQQLILVIDGPPKVVTLPVDLHEHLVEVLSPSAAF
jgi:hypothetical protein